MSEGEKSLGCDADEAASVAQPTNQMAPSRTSTGKSSTVERRSSP
jgi:hypothetical protein